MSQTEMEPKRIGVREFQHNFSKYITAVKHRPVVVTKFGRDQLIVAASDVYELKKKPDSQKKLTSDLEFFGMYKNRRGWKDKPAARIARDLRRAAWYGQKMPY